MQQIPKELRNHIAVQLHRNVYLEAIFSDTSTTGSPCFRDDVSKKVFMKYLDINIAPREDADSDVPGDRTERPWTIRGDLWYAHWRPLHGLPQTSEISYILPVGISLDVVPYQRISTVFCPLFPLFTNIF